MPSKVVSSKGVLHTFQTQKYLPSVYSFTEEYPPSCSFSSLLHIVNKPLNNNIFIINHENLTLVPCKMLPHQLVLKYILFYFNSSIHSKVLLLIRCITLMNMPIFVPSARSSVMTPSAPIILCLRPVQLPRKHYILFSDPR